MAEHVILITGASSGIGLATAHRFAREGFQILMTARNADKLRQAAEPLLRTFPASRIQTCVADLNDPRSPQRIVEQMQREFSRIDILVNAAGYASSIPFDQISAAEFDLTMNTNVRGLFFLTQAVWPIMARQRGGIIVNVSSLAAVDPFPGFSVYGSSKAWVDLFTKALAQEGRAAGIRAYSIRPGAVDTPMLRGLFPDFPADQTVSADEVAEAIWGITTVPFRLSSGQAIAVTRQ